MKLIIKEEKCLKEDLEKASENQDNRVHEDKCPGVVANRALAGLHRSHWNKVTPELPKASMGRSE